MNKKVTGILIDVINGISSTKTITDCLDSYYEILDCSTIDMQDRIIGADCGQQYTIVCDDEGLLKNDPKISAIDDLGRPMFVGNLFIVKVNEDGDVISLSTEDVAYVEQFISFRSTLRYPTPYPVLHQVEYL